jgi:tellurite resistance protein TerC
MGFIVLVLALLGFDLRVINRKPHLISSRQAILWSALWLLLAITFCAFIYLWRGHHDALDFLTAYIIEESLSLDNLVVFAVIFTSAAVDFQYQHRVLFWGILGVLVTRGIFVFAGVELIAHFHWFLYVLGVFLVVTGARLLRKGRGELDPARSRLLNMARKLLPITSTYEGGKFFVRREGRWFATPLLLVLLMIEITDVFFAVDSVPAVFSVTQEPFIVYTSNIFAVLGLRALYFLLAGAVKRFCYLRHALAVVLRFVGAKMLIARIIRIPTGWALLVIMVAISLGVAASLLRADRE